MGDLSAVRAEHEPDWDELMRVADAAESPEARVRLRMTMIQLRTNHLTGKHIGWLAEQHGLAMGLLLDLAQRLSTQEERLSRLEEDAG